MSFVSRTAAALICLGLLVPDSQARENCFDKYVKIEKALTTRHRDLVVRGLDDSEKKSELNAMVDRLTGTCHYTEIEAEQIIRSLDPHYQQWLNGRVRDRYEREKHLPYIRKKDQEMARAREEMAESPMKPATAKVYEKKHFAYNSLPAEARKNRDRLRHTFKCISMGKDVACCSKRENSGCSVTEDPKAQFYSPKSGGDIRTFVQAFEKKYLKEKNVGYMNDHKKYVCFDRPIGVSLGHETNCVRFELSGGEYHSHPMTLTDTQNISADAIKYLKNAPPVKLDGGWWEID